MREKIFLMMFLIAASFSLAIPEENYSQTFDEKVTPFLGLFTQGNFSGIEGRRIAYAKLEVANEAGALLILHGKGESMLKYAEVAYDLAKLNYSIYMLDHRGMGLSERLLDDDDKSYVEDFNYYVLDAKKFVDEVVNSRPHNKKILLAHSMGGAIGALYLERYSDFDKAILSAPMLKINGGAYPEWMAYIVTAAPKWIGFGDAYAKDQARRKRESFNESTVTHSFARYSMWEDYFIGKNPALPTGGVTNRWVKESIEADREARRNAGNVDIPVLLLQADDDSYVLSDGEDEFCARAKNCTKIFFPGSKHEILMEKDDVRNKALEDIMTFVSE